MSKRIWIAILVATLTLLTALGIQWYFSPISERAAIEQAESYASSKFSHMTGVSFTAISTRESGEGRLVALEFSIPRNQVASSDQDYLVDVEYSTFVEFARTYLAFEVGSSEIADADGEMPLRINVELMPKKGRMTDTLNFGDIRPKWDVVEESVDEAWAVSRLDELAATRDELSPLSLLAEVAYCELAIDEAGSHFGLRSTARDGYSDSQVALMAIDFSIARRLEAPEVLLQLMTKLANHDQPGDWRIQACYQEAGRSLGFMVSEGATTEEDVRDLFELSSPELFAMLQLDAISDTAQP
jgi:hypothetical protein